MKGIRSQKSLEVVLSRLEGFSEAKVRLEQYSTPAHIAAEMVWHASLQGYIEGKVIADLGCGPGILGIGALLCGAKKVLFVESEPDVLDICRKNLAFLKSEGYTLGKAEFIQSRVEELKGVTCDLVLQNPPFGTKVRHADKEFLEKAMAISNRIYTFHKSETVRFVSSISKDKGFFTVERFNFKFPLSSTMKHHKKRIQYIDVSCWLLEKSL